MKRILINIFRKIIFFLNWRNIWNSPTLTTWASYISRVLSIFIVLPLVLIKFSTADISIWYLFLTIMGFQSIADLGFGVTFIRIIAFAMGGAEKFGDLKDIQPKNKKSSPNIDALKKIVRSMYSVYAWLTPIIFFLLVIVGTLSLKKPISQSDNIEHAWISWLIVILATTIIFRGSIYSNYLQGINKIALLRRWQAIISIFTIFTSFTVLMFGGGLLSLVITNQTWLIINIAINYYFCNKSKGLKFKEFKKSEKDVKILDAVWPRAWRSGLGILIYTGSIQASSLIYAQVSDVANLASFLLALRFLNNLKVFSSASLYSKIPLLSRLRAEGNLENQIRIAKTGMQLSHWVFVIVFLLIGIFASPLLKMIGSNAVFVDPLLWALLGLGYFFERFGAMHIQLYSITNHIIWHIANGVSGFIYLSLSLLLLDKVDVYAFAIALIIAQLGFYTWYSAKHSYKIFNLKFWEFEKNISLIPFILMCIFLTWSIC